MFVVILYCTCIQFHFYSCQLKKKHCWWSKINMYKLKKISLLGHCLLLEIAMNRLENVLLVHYVVCYEI